MCAVRVYRRRTSSFIHIAGAERRNAAFRYVAIYSLLRIELTACPDHAFEFAIDATDFAKDALS